MSLAKLVVTAVKVEGRTKAEVSRTYGVSSRWIYELCRRYDGEGEAGLQPRSRRPNRVRNKTGTALEDEIVELRKELTDLGVDDGAHTIQIHLQRHHRGKSVPSVARLVRIMTTFLVTGWEVTTLGLSSGDIERRSAIPDGSASRRPARVVPGVREEYLGARDPGAACSDPSRVDLALTRVGPYHFPRVEPCGYEWGRLARLRANQGNRRRGKPALDGLTGSPGPVRNR